MPVWHGSKYLATGNYRCFISVSDQTRKILIGSCLYLLQ